MNIINGILNSNYIDGEAIIITLMVIGFIAICNVANDIVRTIVEIYYARKSRKNI